MSVYDDDIDLRPYILALISNLWLILLLAIIGAGAAWILSREKPPSYTATATILVTRNRPTLSIAGQFPTISEPIDSASQMEAYKAIARSDHIASETMIALKASLPDSETLGTFRNRVGVSHTGDLIFLTASAGKSKEAADISNEWARRAVQAINLAYSEDAPLTEIQSQAEVAQSEYGTNQLALEEFLRTSQVDLLEKKVAEAKTILSKMVNDRAWQFSYYSNRRQSMEDLIVQAEALKQQLNDGSSSAAAGIGDALAVLKLRASAFEISPVPDPVIAQKSDTESNSIISTNVNPMPDRRSELNFDLQLSEISALDDANSAYVTDLDQLISQARIEQELAEEKLQELSLQLTQNQGNASIEEAAVQIQALESQLESERAKLKELTSKRDLSWNTYQSFIQKETEIKNNAQTNSQVKLASLAIPSQVPVPSVTKRNTLVGGAMGLMVGVLLVLGIQWWRIFNQPSKSGFIPSKANPAE